jgi:phosphomannomutase
MPHYAATLRDSIVREIQLGLDEEERSDIPLPLAGLRIVLNSGHGSGGFFYHVLHDLGADVSQCQLLNLPDASFPRGIPNPESDRMVQETTRLCEEIEADIGIMLDTDADRCGFIVPTSSTTFSYSPHQYQPLNRNRLIALLGRIFSERSPGCAIVTDSVTSEGLSKFLNNLGVKHVRYLKGYANVIEKAMELTQSGQTNAEVAIETSGHCAMKENGYLDDGTYTAVKVIACLAQVVARDRSYRNLQSDHDDESIGGGISSNSTKPPSNLLDLISTLEELEEVKELRISVKDGSLETTDSTFQELCRYIEDACHKSSNGWELDVDNLEGIRARTTGSHGGFFMLRKSLHDPLLSLQVEGRSKDEVRAQVIEPILQLLSNSSRCMEDLLDLTVLQSY